MLFAGKIIHSCQKFNIRYLSKLTTPKSWHEPTGYNTGIQIYNCVTRSTVPLILRNEHFATFYTCGPTVYDSAHIGHASCYIKLDIIQRILRNYFNINLITAMNITDIDDKIIKRSVDEKIAWNKISKKYEHEFWNDLKNLQIIEPDIKIRVTENIPIIVEFIENIFNKNLAYIGKDKSIYFKVDKCPSYGKLQRINVDETKHDFKESQADFALWKYKKYDNEPSWESPWGYGRPGWHIECSALASKIFGQTIDFHAGGLDLRFPHHENEEAQSCAFHNHTQWVNYWLHTGQLNLKGESDKMSKSLKNTISINEMLENYTSDEFRMSCILSNYRNFMEYSDENMETAKSILNKFISFNSDTQAYLDGRKSQVNFNYDMISLKLKETTCLVDNSLRNDFNTSKSIGHLIDLISNVSKLINTNINIKETFSNSNNDIILAAKKYSNRILSIFGIDLEKNILDVSNSEIDIKMVINEIISIRTDLRKLGISTKNKEYFQICDSIRGKLKNAGIEIKDHNGNSSWMFSTR